MKISLLQVGGVERWRLTNWRKMMRMIVFRYLVLDKGGNISVSYLWSIHLVDNIKDCIYGLGYWVVKGVGYLVFL